MTRVGEEPPSEPLPNNKLADREALLHWSKFHGPYEYTHVQIFQSIPHLFEMLQSADLRAISTAMQKDVGSMIHEARSEWTKILKKVGDASKLLTFSIGPCSPCFDLCSFLPGMESAATRRWAPADPAGM